MCMHFFWNSAPSPDVIRLAASDGWSCAVPEHPGAGIIPRETRGSSFPNLFTYIHLQLFETLILLYQKIFTQIYINMFTLIYLSIYSFVTYICYIPIYYELSRSLHVYTYLLLLVNYFMLNPNYFLFIHVIFMLYTYLFLCSSMLFSLHNWEFCRLPPLRRPEGLPAQGPVGAVANGRLSHLEAGG